MVAERRGFRPASAVVGRTREPIRCPETAASGRTRSGGRRAPSPEAKNDYRKVVHVGPGCSALDGRFAATMALVSHGALLLTQAPLCRCWALFSECCRAPPAAWPLGSLAESVIALSQYFGLDPLLTLEAGPLR